MAGILNSLSKIEKREVVLSVRDIKKTFMEGGQPLRVLSGGGFDLHRGEIIALVGQSGSGKSTLLQCVGLLDKPTSGSILICGVPVQKMNDEERTLFRRQKIGFVYQRHNLLSDFTALENVTLAVKLQNPKTEYDKIDEYEQGLYEIGEIIKGCCDGCVYKNENECGSDDECPDIKLNEIMRKISEVENNVKNI